MRVTEKGQVTIPKNVRRHLDIRPGSEVEFTFAGDGALLRKVEVSSEERSREVRELLDHIRKHKGSMNLAGMTSDEFYKMLRD
ncbi:AbrB/MazE/SpoVT family DNA-binding domain-containing protein [Arvimicrobium flavum]|uniref:AbrB/MazE/SpoVT family DNA-binding domain-containing protein n=1 Tax=Arvimicrobium flavum TaxID=3393320 RepID=UPI00237BB79F|nr:AbrB/MazE/SpoVT family DNA-binding domain-containing protein [Mesorhizobium shangrilense]